MTTTTSLPAGYISTPADVVNGTCRRCGRACFVRNGVVMQLSQEYARGQRYNRGLHLCYMTDERIAAEQAAAEQAARKAAAAERTTRILHRYGAALRAAMDAGTITAEQAGDKFQTACKRVGWL
jgi:hypothetical protein